MPTYTLKDLLDIDSAINDLPAIGIKVDISGSIALAKNQQLIKPYVDGFKNAIKVPAEYNNYRREVDALVQEYKDKKSTEDEDIKAANNKIQEINKKYESVLAEVIELEALAATALTETYELELFLINSSSLAGSSESLVSTMTKLLSIIKD